MIILDAEKPLRPRIVKEWDEVMEGSRFKSQRGQKRGKILIQKEKRKNVDAEKAYN